MTLAGRSAPFCGRRCRLLESFVAGADEGGEGGTYGLITGGAREVRGVYIYFTAVCSLISRYNAFGKVWQGIPLGKSELLREVGYTGGTGEEWGVVILGVVF